MAVAVNGKWQATGRCVLQALLSSEGEAASDVGSSGSSLAAGSVRHATKGNSGWRIAWS
jgi:hypothetical protein